MNKKQKQKAAQALREWREKAGLSQRDFSAMFARPTASQALVAHWETGRQEFTPERAVQIEVLTNSAVSRAVLRPDMWGAA